MVKLVCTRCQTVLSVPDQILPEREQAKLGCPICHQPMELSREARSTARMAQASRQPPESSPRERESVHFGDEVTALQLIEAEGKRALLCIGDQALAEKAARSAREMDFHVVVAQKPTPALSQLENTRYHVIVLHGSCGGRSFSENPVVLHLQRMPMGARRASFVCLLSEEAATLDHMAAFRVGADLVVNVQDLEKFRTILNHMLRNKVTSYSIFDDELKRKGNALI